MKEISIGEVGRKGGKWDYEGLAEYMRKSVSGKKGEKKAYEIGFEEVYEFHSEKGESIDPQHKGHYAKQAVRKAVSKIGECLKVSQSGDKVKFVIRVS